MINKILKIVAMLVAFIVGGIVTMQFMGDKYGYSLFHIFEKPGIVEKVVEVPVVKVVIISDDATIVVINQEYRDTLMKLTEMNANFRRISEGEKTVKRIKMLANQALSFPEQLVKEKE